MKLDNKSMNCAGVLRTLKFHVQAQCEQHLRVVKKEPARAPN